MQIINDFDLYDTIFSVLPLEITTAFSGAPGPRETALSAASILHRLLHPREPSNLPPLHATLLAAVNTDPSCKARLYLGAALTPYKDITYRDKKKKTQSAIDLVLRESLKLGTQHHFLDGIPSLFAAAQLLENPVLQSDKFQRPSERVAIG